MKIAGFYPAGHRRNPNPYGFARAWIWAESIGFWWDVAKAPLPLPQSRF